MRAHCRRKKGQESDDPPPVLGPERLLPEEDDASGGQVPLVDLPALQLPPVEHDLARRLFDRRDRRGSLAPEDPRRQSARPFSDRSVPDQVTTDDPVPEKRLGGSVDRRVRDLGEPAKDVAGDRREASRVRAIAREDDDALPGQIRHPLELLLNRQPGEGEDLQAWSLLPDQPAREGLRVAVVRRGATQDHDAPGVRVEAEGNSHRLLFLQRQDGARRVPRQWPGRETSLVHVDEDRLSRGEQALPVVPQVAQCLRAGRDHHVDRPGRVLLAQEIGQQLPVGRGRRIRQVEVLDVQFDGCAELLLHRLPKSRLHGSHRRRRVSEREEQEDGRGRNLLGGRCAERGQGEERNPQPVQRCFRHSNQRH